MTWVDEQEAKTTPYRCVLVGIAGSEDGQAPAVAVGYWKYKGKGEANLWVVPGARAGFTVSHWSDCLGDDFSTPLWPGTVAGGPLSNRVNRT